MLHVRRYKSLVHFFIKAANIFVFPLFPNQRPIPSRIHNVSDYQPQSQPPTPDSYAEDPPTQQPESNTLIYPPPPFQTTTPCPQAGSAPVLVPLPRIDSKTTIIRLRSTGWRLRRRRSEILRMRDGLVWGRNHVCILMNCCIGRGWLMGGMIDVVKDSLWTKVKRVLKRSMM